MIMISVQAKFVTSVANFFVIIKERHRKHHLGRYVFPCLIVFIYYFFSFFPDSHPAWNSKSGLRQEAIQNIWIGYTESEM